MDLFEDGVNGVFGVGVEDREIDLQRGAAVFLQVEPQNPKFGRALVKAG